MRWVLFGAGIALLLTYWILAKDAFSQQPHCDDSEVLAAQLHSGFGERAIGAGVVPATSQRPSGLMTLFANRETGTWTLVITAFNQQAPSNYVSCVAGSGEGFRLTAAERPDT